MFHRLMQTQRTGHVICPLQLRTIKGFTDICSHVMYGAFYNTKYIISTRKNLIIVSSNRSPRRLLQRNTCKCAVDNIKLILKLECQSIQPRNMQCQVHRTLKPRKIGCFQTLTCIEARVLYIAQKMFASNGGKYLNTR